ncbi:MAG: hypothetical protein KTR16_06895 [Acidiferrobacterales bacterium]|nr:hypothetical protein [Acidiferrobacterales bacterium]
MESNYFKYLIARVSVVLILLSASGLTLSQDVSFSSSGLINESVNNPTSLEFGPDGRLYVSQQDGVIWAFTIQRDDAEPGSGQYTAVNAEQITLIQQGIINHTDDGTPTTVALRQVTGIKTAGTATNPILYVTSSDNLIGGGGSANDKNLDTNSGVLSKLTFSNGSWSKIDLVRGLPRCEENHSTNGMDIFDKGGQTYMVFQQGGHTNKGAPSNNFVGTPEYLLSGALLVVNLSQLESMQIYTDPRTNTQYVYDLPTLNDPNREDIDASDSRFPYPSGHPMEFSTIDVGDPFGGADGLNQSFAELGGPVQVFSPGYRNAYDVVVTESGNIFTFDNGPNTGWGGLPVIYDSAGAIKSDQTIANYDPDNGDYVKNDFNEVGSSGHGDTLHYVGTINDTFGTYYGGHANPIAAFPLLADLITYKNISGSWTETSRHQLPNLLPGVSGYFNVSFTATDFPGDPRLGEYLAGAITSNKVNILDIINSSTNGMAEYTASNFNNALKGNLLAVSFNGDITRYELNATGDDIVNDEVIFSGFGSTPLDVTTQSDNDIFPGTIWAAVYGPNNIAVFEPSDVLCIDDGNPNSDSDNDGYTNQDELDNGLAVCSGGITPPDNDLDFISDLNDSDDDNDLIADINDAYAIDPDNGLTTNMPVDYPFWNNDPGTGFFGLGFTGLMLDPSGGTDYLTQYDEENISFGGAAGKASIDLVPTGDAYQSINTQDYGFQYGVNVTSVSPPFTIHSRIESPFFGINGSGTRPVDDQTVGIFIGEGNQDDYLKVVLGYGTSAADAIDGVQIVLEDDGIVTTDMRYDLVDLLTINAVDIYLSVDPSASTVQVYVSTDGGVTVSAVGTSITVPVSFFDDSDGFGMATGIISSSTGSTAVPFSAAWDFLNVSIDQPGIIETSVGSGGVDFGTITVDSEATLINLGLKNLSGPADPQLSITNLQIIGPDAILFSTSVSLPLVLGPGGEINVPVSFDPIGTPGVKSATLVVTVSHSGMTEDINIPLTAVITEVFQPLYRINAGGSQVLSNDSGPNWIGDSPLDAEAIFTVNTGNVSGYQLSFEDRHSSIPSYIDEATFNDIFAEERWDPFSGSEMLYSIPLPNESYIVRLYIGNGWEGADAVGDRIFDIEIEDQILVDNLDLIATFGHEVGGVVEVPVSVSDGELNIEFIHQLQNTLVNAIEIVGPPSEVLTLILDPIDDQSNEVGEQIDFTVVGSGGDPFKNITYSILGQPDGVQIEPTNGQIFGTIGATSLSGGIAHDGVHTVSVTLSQSGSTSVVQEFQWVITPPDACGDCPPEDEFEPIYRINSGGPTIDANDSGPDWIGDFPLDSSAIFTINTGQSSIYSLQYDARDQSIPSYIDEVTFNGIFASERWDAASGREMMYSLPLDAGDYVVKLYLGNGWYGADEEGDRIFDVNFEGITLVDDLDLIESFGHQVGGVVEVPVSVSDGLLNIEFIHQVQNPIINAIEVLQPVSYDQPSDDTCFPITTKNKSIAVICF